MKKYVCLFLALVLCLSLCACGGSEPEMAVPETTVPETTVPETTIPETTVPETEPAPENVLRDLAAGFDDNAISQMIQWQNNRQNDGAFILADNWVYGMGSDESGRKVAFIKCRLDFTEKTVLEEGWVFFPHVKDGYIYYMFHSNAKKGVDGLYRMRTSGTGKVKLSDMYGSMQIWGDTIYLSSGNTEKEEDAYCLFAMDLDGSNLRKVIDKPVFHWFVFGDAILYQDDGDNESLHIVDVEGRDTKLNDEASYWPIFDGEHIYYVKDNDDDRSIWRVDLDGQNDTKIAEYDVSTGFVLHKDRIYFVYHDDGDRVYSIKKDGSDLTQVSQDEPCGDLQFIGDLLKYTDYHVQGKNYYMEATWLCDEDGTHLIDFCKLK